MFLGRLNNPASDAFCTYETYLHQNSNFASEIKLEEKEENGNKTNAVFCNGEESNERSN